MTNDKKDLVGQEDFLKYVKLLNRGSLDKCCIKEVAGLLHLQEEVVVDIINNYDYLTEKFKCEVMENTPTNYDHLVGKTMNTLEVLQNWKDDHLRTCTEGESCQEVIIINKLMEVFK